MEDHGIQDFNAAGTTKLAWKLIAFLPHLAASRPKIPKAGYPCWGIAPSLFTNITGRNVFLSEIIPWSYQKKAESGSATTRKILGNSDTYLIRISEPVPSCNGTPLTIGK